MRSMRIRWLSWCSGLGLLTLAVVPVSAKCPVCHSCCAEKTTPCATTPCDKVEQTSVASGSIALKSNASEASSKHSLLILNCPADSRVTIDGQVTHASGAMRQYRLSFRDENYKGRIEVRLRDNEEKVTYDFEAQLHCRHQGREVLTVTRDRMTPTPDKPEKKCEGVLTSLSEKSKPGTVIPAKAEPPSTLQQTITHHQKLYESQQTTTDNFEKELAAKRTRWEAAVGIRKRLQDAHRLKITEVDLAKSDSAATLNAKKLELVKLEMEEQRATEVEGEARAEFVEAKKRADEAQGQVRDITAKLNYWKLMQSIAQQTKAVEQATSETQRLTGVVNSKEELQKLTSKIRQAEDDGPRKDPKEHEIAITLLREAERNAKVELTKAREELNKAEGQLRDEQERLKAIQFGTLKLDSK